MNKKIFMWVLAMLASTVLQVAILVWAVHAQLYSG